MSSVAAVIPAPTRTLYAASKSSSLILFKALSIEHPQIRFTTVLPATVSPFPIIPARLNHTHLNNKIEGDFRASAVDGGVVHEDVIKVTLLDLLFITPLLTCSTELEERLCCEGVRARY